MQPDQDNNQQQNNQANNPPQQQPQQQQPQPQQAQTQPQVQNQPQPQQTMSQQTNYAGFWIRFLAVIIDSVILFIPSLIIGMILGGAGLDNEAFLNLVSFAIGFGYFTYLESSEKQATFGKQALNLKVTDENGQRIDLTKASVRYLSKILSGLILLIGYIMAGFDSKKQALHDKIANTYVVKA